MKVCIATALRWLADRLAPVPTPVQVTNTIYLDGNEIRGLVNAEIGKSDRVLRHVLKIGDKP